MGYYWLILGWVLYCIVHSLLAANPVKNFFYATGISTRNYRLLYNIVAIITLIPIALISASIPKELIIKSGPVFKIFGLIVAGYGVILGKIAFKSYNSKAFLGLGDMKVEEKFSTDGMLKRMRHPLYSALLLIIIGYVLFHPTYSTLISAGMLTLYVLVGIQLEERKLVRQFGEQYVEYKRNTPMLIPKFRK